MIKVNGGEFASILFNKVHVLVNQRKKSMKQQQTWDKRHIPAL